MRRYYVLVKQSTLGDDKSIELQPMPGKTVETMTIMKKSLLLLLLISGTFALHGCVYRATISQGNLIEQDDLDQVEVGMTRNQIRFLLGSPMIDDPFHQDRWDYVYYLKIGRKDATAKRWVSIEFENDVVSEIRDDQALEPDL